MRCRTRTLKPTALRRRPSVVSALLGLLAIPTLVRGAAEGASLLQELHDAVVALNPEEISGPAQWHEVAEDNQLLPSPTNPTPAQQEEPIQVLVARCQAESHLEHYGEELEAPVLRARILAPNMRDVEVRLPTAEGDLSSLLHRIQAQAKDILLERSCLIPASHQPQAEVVTLITIPQWISTSLHTVIAIDLTAIGGPFFADINQPLMYRSELERLAAVYCRDGIAVFTQGNPEAWEAGIPYKVQTGQTIQVCKRGTHPFWRGPPDGPFWQLWKRCDPPSLFQQPWPGWLVVREDTAWIITHEGDQTHGLYQKIADKVGCDLSQLCFQKEPSGFAQRDFAYAGRPVLGIVAIAPRDPNSTVRPVESSFTFVDARQVGKGIRAFLRDTGPDAASILRSIHPRVPSGFTTYIRTRSRSDTCQHITPWDWQEVGFRPCDTGGHSHGPDLNQGQASEPLQTEVSTTADSGAVSHTEPVGVYAAVTSGPLGPVHIPDDRLGDLDRTGDKIWFLLIAPDRQAEIVGIPNHSPLTWDEALASVVEARDAEDNALYGHIVKVHPQPSSEFATLLCLPLWACNRTCVLIDCRDFDGRLFGFMIDPWIQWSSFLLQIGLPEGDDVVVSSSFSHFWVLYDGGSRGIDADYHAITNIYGFQEFVADELQYAHYRTTLKTARPRIDDAVYRGVMCKAVVLVTECLPTVPVPPGRIMTPLTVVFVDLRPVLKGLDWRIFVRGEYALDLFERGLRLDTPEGHHIHIEGGTYTTRHGVNFIHAEDRAVLRVSFRATPVDATADRASHSGSGGDSDTSSDASGSSSSTSEGESHRRSRSPRRRKGPRRNKGRAGEVTDFLPPLEIVVAHCRCPILVADPLSQLWSASPLGCDLGQLFACLQKSYASAVASGIGPQSLKILTEPNTVSVADALTIAQLRYAAPRLGVPWRYMTPALAPHIDDTESSDSDNEWLQTPFRVGFRILTPGYATEQVNISVNVPTTVDVVLSMVQRARSPVHARNFPRLVAANPQPLVGEGVFLACPVWSTDIAAARRTVCVDCSGIDGRVFAALAPAYVERADILELANLPRNLEFDVYAGPYADRLGADSQCHLADGDTFFILPEDDAPPTSVPLPIALLGRQHWDRQPRFPEPTSHGVCCAVFGQDNILHINIRGSPAAFRMQIASAIGVQQRALRILSSQPRIWDAALDGRTCRSVVIVYDADSSPEHSVTWILLDVRSLYLGWRSLQVPGRQISVREIVDGLLSELGSGWRIWLRNVPLSADLIGVHNGQVFAVDVLHNGNRPEQGMSSSSMEQGPVSTFAPHAEVSSYQPAHDAQENPDAGSQPVESGDATPSGGHGTTTSRGQDNGEPPSAVPADDIAYIGALFLLLSQNYIHEWVSVRFARDTPIATVLDIVAVARRPDRAVRMPIVCAVHPQPRSDHAVAVCMPEWNFSGAIIAVDSRACNDRLFAVQLNGTACREDFLRLAGVQDETDPEVFFRDMPWPLPPDRLVSPINGDLVLIKPRDAAVHIVSSLSDMLQSPSGWGSFPEEHENRSDVAWILDQAGPTALRVPSGRQHRAGHEIAVSVGRRLRDIIVTPAFGGIVDFANLGVVVRNVVIVRSNEDSARDGRRVIACILDLRPLLLGFDWIACHEGIFLPEPIIRRFSNRCPPGFCLGRVCDGVYFQPLQDPFLVQEGEVITLALRRVEQNPERASVTRPNITVADDAREPDRSNDAAGPRAPSHSSGSHPPDGHVGGRNDDGADDQLQPREHPAVGDAPSRVAGPTVIIGHPHPNKAQCITGLVLATTTTVNAVGTRSAESLSWKCTAGHDKWSSSFPNDAFLEGGWSLTPVYICAFLALLLYVATHTHTANRRLSATRRPRFLCRIIWLPFVLQPSSAVQTITPRSDGKADEFTHGVAGQPAIRQIPTPCRNDAAMNRIYGHQGETACVPPPRTLSSMPLGAVEEGQNSPCHANSLMTLLEESITYEHNQAFFLAATLLETLTEFFAEQHSQDVGSNVPQPLYLHQYVRPPVFSLDAESVPLPHKGTLLNALFQPWPMTWLLPTNWTCADLPATTAAALSQINTWKHFHTWGPNQEVSFTIYTDGSASLAQPASGYATVIFAHTKDATFLLGVLGGRLLSNNDSPWVVDCPPALHAEHVAIAVALLWCLQMKGVLQALQCQIRFDCYAAGWSAEGTWRTLSHTGALVHHLDMIARATPGLFLSYAHVKGHSDHPWNDMADYVAKSASRQQAWPEPPREICAAIHDCDIAWLAPEQDARSHHAMPIFDGTFSWAPPADDWQPLLPEHVVPTTEGTASQQGLDGKTYCAKVATVNIQSLRGKCKYIEEQLHARHINLVCLQETKLDSGAVTSQHYLRLHSRADSHWGVAIWIHRTLGLLNIDGKPLSVDEHDISFLHEGPRLLVLIVTKGDTKIGLVSGHCPHTSRPAEREVFLSLVAPLLRRLRRAHLVIGGIDLNGRIPLNYQGVSGDLEFGEADDAGWSFAAILADSGLWMPSMFSQLHCGESATYTHPSGQQHRIDYIFLGGQAVVTRVRSEVDETFDNGSPQEDHALLWSSLQGYLDTSSQVTRLHRVQYDRDKLMTMEGRAVLRQVLSTFQHPGWDVCPDQHCRAIESHLQRALDEHFPVPRTPKRASYIPDKVWQHRDQKLRFKHQVRHRSRLWKDLLCRAFLQWKEEQNYGVITLLGKQRRLYELAAAAVKLATRKIKRDVLLAKNDFLHKVATEGHQGAAKILQRVKKAGVGGTKTRPISRPLPLLLHPDDGSAVTTRRQRDDVWMLHFGRQEQGSATRIQDFIREAASSCYQADVEWTAAMLPTYADVEQVIRAIPRNKAAGLDNIPGEALKAVPAESARVLLPLFLKSMVLQHQPIQWRGGILYEAFKCSGLQSSVDNYRSLFVSSYLAKTYHRVVRNKTQTFCRDDFHPLHLGSKKCAPVTFAAMFVLAHLRRGHATCKSVAILYLDTSAAYYRIVRELAVGDIRSDDTVARLFERFGLTGDDLRDLRETVEAGGMLAQAGAPDALRQVVKDIHMHTWFVSRFSDGSKVCSSLAGSRPGESWADLIYAYIYGRVLSKIHEYAVAEGLTFHVPFDPESGVFPPSDTEEVLAATDATWADDSAFPIEADDPAELMRQTQRLCMLVISFCEGHGMSPNLKPGKTSAMIRLVGKGHKKVRQSYFPGGTRSLHLPDLGVGVAVTDQYRHLGGFVDCKLSMRPEVRHRLAQASSSYDASKKLLLGSSRLTLPTRAALFESAITPTFFNIGLWVPNGKPWESICDGYSKLVRRLLVPVVGAQRAFHVPLPVAHWHTGCWRLTLIARRARLSLLLSLVQTGPPLLWAMLQSEASWLAAIRDDLKWLTEEDADNWPPLVAPAWPTWHHLIKQSPQMFRRRVRRRLQQSHTQQVDSDAVLVCLWHCCRTVPRSRIEAPQAAAWTCFPCNKTFGTKAGLSVHFFKTHGRVAAYRQVAKGTVCEACNTSFWSVGRLAAHLRSSPGCVAELVNQGKQALQLAPGFGSKKRRQADSADFTLSLPDRRGCIPPPPTEQQWSGEQKSAYKTLCEGLLSVTRDTLPTELTAVVGVLFSSPLYPNEIVSILDRTSEEVRLLHEDDPCDPWEPDTVHNLLCALNRARSRCCTENVSDEAPSGACHSLKDFQRLMHNFDWPKSVASDHGTLPSFAVTVPPRWEAEWRQHCSKLGISAVAADYGVLLPDQLRQAWTKIVEHCIVHVHAPPEFWSHPLAAPFECARPPPACPN